MYTRTCAFCKRRAQLHAALRVHHQMQYDQLYFEIFSTYHLGVGLFQMQTNILQQHQFSCNMYGFIQIIISPLLRILVHNEEACTCMSTFIIFLAHILL